MADYKAQYMRGRRRRAITAVVTIVSIAVLLYVIPRVMNVMWAVREADERSGSVNALFRGISTFRDAGGPVPVFRDDVRRMITCGGPGGPVDNRMCGTDTAPGDSDASVRFIGKWRYSRNIVTRNTPQTVCRGVAAKRSKRLLIYGCLPEE